MLTTYRFFALAALGAGCLIAASVTGQVQDQQGARVANAAVTLVSETGDAQWNTNTNQSGAYNFQNVAPGDYLLESHASGFASYRLEHVKVDAGSALDLKLTLQLGAVQQEISVTASSTPQSVDQVSKALSIVSQSSMEDRDVYSLGAAVVLTPGVRVNTEGGPGAFTEIRLRGLPPQDTSVLVDGLRLRDPSGTQADATSLLDDFVMADTSHIEVLRGSGSSLYGTNAIGGVVNVLTDQGGGPTRGTLLLEGGSLGTFRGTATLDTGTKDDRLQFSAGLTHLNVTEGVDGDQPARTTSAQGRLAYRLTSNTQIVARFFGSDGFAILSNDPVGLVDNATGIVNASPNLTFTPSIADTDYRRTGRYETGALSLLGQPTTALGYAIDYQVVNSTRTYVNGPAGTGYQPDGITRSDYDGRTQTVNARANLQAGDHNLLTAGYEFEDESYNSGSTAVPDIASNSWASAVQTSNSVFGQDQIRLFHNNLYISLGGRAQYFSLDNPVFLPASSAPYAGVQFNAPPPAYTGDASFAYLVRGSNTKIRGHVGRGYRAPSLYERFGAGYDEFFGYSVYGDPALRPEQSISVDTGIDQALLHETLHLSATYFYTRLQHVIAFDESGIINSVTDPYGRDIGYLNTQGGLSRGVEFSANWAVNSALNVSSAYTYTDAREEAALVPEVWRTFITPMNQFSALVVQRFGKRVFVDASFIAASNYLTELFNADFTPIAYRFSGQKHLDAGASYQIPLSESRSVRLYAQAANLLNQNYYESGFLTPGVTAKGGLEFQF